MTNYAKKKNKPVRHKEKKTKKIVRRKKRFNRNFLKELVAMDPVKQNPGKEALVELELSDIKTNNNEMDLELKKMLKRQRNRGTKKVKGGSILS